MLGTDYKQAGNTSNFSIASAGAGRKHKQLLNSGCWGMLETQVTSQLRVLGQAGYTSNSSTAGAGAG